MLWSEGSDRLEEEKRTGRSGENLGKEGLQRGLRGLGMDGGREEGEADWLYRVLEGWGKRDEERGRGKRTADWIRHFEGGGGGKRQKKERWRRSERKRAVRQVNWSEVKQTRDEDRLKHMQGFIGWRCFQRGRSDWVMMDGGKTTEWTAAALTCHLSVMTERREKGRKGGVTVWFF